MYEYTLCLGGGGGGGRGGGGDGLKRRFKLQIIMSNWTEHPMYGVSNNIPDTVTRRVTLVAQELPILSEQNSSTTRLYWGVHYIFFYVVFCDDNSLCFIPFHLAIIMSVLLQIPASDYSCGIFTFKLFSLGSQVRSCKL